jgi:hypothetical protein
MGRHVHTVRRLGIFIPLLLTPCACLNFQPDIHKARTGGSKPIHAEFFSTGLCAVPKARATFWEGIKKG